MGQSYTKDQVDFSSAHPKFKSAQVITQKDIRFIRTTIPADDEGLDAWKKNLKKNQKILKASNFLLLPLKHTYSKNGMCAHSGNAVIDYDYYPYLLSEEIGNRRQKQQKFRQSDLWYLLYSLAGARNQLGQSTQKIGDIRPQNVFINYDGLVKVGNLFSWPNQQTNYKKAINQQVTFLAPEDLHKLELGAIDNEQNINSQTFAIGLTIIAAGILQNPSDIYNLKNFSFNSGLATDLINRWKNSKNYSQIFRSIVSNLVQFNPDDRLTIDQLWSWISKYSHNIKSKEKFLITSVPKKIEKEVASLRSFTKSSNTNTDHQTYQSVKKEQETVK